MLQENKKMIFLFPDSNGSFKKKLKVFKNSYKFQGLCCLIEEWLYVLFFISIIHTGMHYKGPKFHISGL